MITRTRRRLRRTAGFTILELLISMLLAGGLMVVIFFVYFTNTEQYYRQEQIVQMQETMRFAMEYLKNDLRNAGLLSVANGTGRNEPDPFFCGQADEMVGVRLFEGDGAPAILGREGNGLVPDRLRLLVDASGALPLWTEDVNGAVVTIAPTGVQTTDASRALLTNEGTAELEALYKRGYYLRISGMDTQKTDLVAIAGVNFGGSPTITLARNPCFDTSECAGRCMVNVVQMVEYAVVEDEDDADKTNLVRRLIDSRDASLIPDSSLLLAEYIVNLQLWGTYDTRPPGVGAPVILADSDPTDDVGNWPGGGQETALMAEHIARLRGLNVVVAARTPREDPTFLLKADGQVDPDDRVAADRTWFDVTAAPGLARVATVSSVISTPNMFRGLQ